MTASGRAGRPDVGFVLHINVQRFRGGLVFKAHRLCVSLNSRLESNKEEEEYRREEAPAQRAEAAGRAQQLTVGLSLALPLVQILISTILNLRTTTSHKCAVVPRKARS